MNALVRRYLKTAIVFLVVGLGLGLWLLVAREFGLPISWRLPSAHTHALLVGFVLMMIAGVALWMFPRAREGDARYRPVLAEIAWWLIAGGTALRVVLEAIPGPASSAPLRSAIVAAGTLQVGGLALFFIGLWPRIRSSGANPEGR